MKQGAHGGNIYEAARMLGVTQDEIHDYSSNVSPFQTKVLAGQDTNALLSRLPEPHSKTLQREYESKYSLPDGSAVITAGTTEAIEKLCRIYAGKKALLLAPAYSDYEQYCSSYGLEISYILLSAENDFSFDLSSFRGGADICFICNPSNPTGKTIPKKDILTLAEQHRETLFVIDESYVRFHKKPEEISLLGCDAMNIAVLRSYSKTYGQPGLRMGAAVSYNTALTDTIRSHISPWSVNCIAQRAGQELLYTDVTENIERIHHIKSRFLSDIADIPYISAVESDVNYFLCRLKGVSSGELFAHCLSDRVLIRDCSNFKGLSDEYVRFAVAKDMSPLLKSLKGFSR